VSCKVSGLVTEAARDWRPEQVAPSLDVLVESFGPGRLMFGSDRPMCTTAASYAEVLGLVTEPLSRGSARLSSMPCWAVAPMADFSSAVRIVCGI
jgi:predicted TIM-barrel fold metal-dependent hydrolase